MKKKVSKRLRKRTTTKEQNLSQLKLEIYVKKNCFYRSLQNASVSIVEDKYATYVQLCYIFFVLPWFIVLVRQAGAALVDRHRPFPDWVEAAPYIFFFDGDVDRGPAASNRR
jgi:hypothetical protein